MVDRSIVRGVEKMLGRLRCSLDNLARMARVSSVSSAGPRVTATASANELGEVHEQVQVLEPYGFTSVPPAGSQGLLVCFGGDGAHPVLLSVGNPGTRLAGLADGELAIHIGSVATGPRIVLRAGGNIEVNPGPGGKVQVVPSGAVAPLAVARETDPTQQNSTDLTTINTIVGAWNALLPGGGPLVVPPGPPLTPCTGAGTIDRGGDGMVST